MLQALADFCGRSACEGLLHQNIGKIQAAEYNEEGNTSWQTMALRELETLCTQQDSGFGAAQWMLRHQEGPVKSCHEQLQNISQSIAFREKKKKRKEISIYSCL